MTTVDERVAALEARLDHLQQLLDERLPQPATHGMKEKLGWQAIVGTFADDALYEEAMRLGQKWRQSQQEDASKDES